MHACWKSRNLFKVMLNEKQHVSALSWQPIVTVGIQVPNGTEQPFAENRRRGWWEVSPSYVSESRLGLGLHSAYQGVIYKELVGIDGKKRNRLIYRVVESLEVQFLPLLCLTMCCCGYLRVLRQTLIACQTAGKRGRGRNLGRLAGLSDGSSCGRQSNALFLVQCKPAAYSFTSMFAIARQSRVQATLACTTTVYPYSSPISPDIVVCCAAGWRLTFEIMRTRCLSSGWHRSTDNIVLGVPPTKNIGPISIRPNMASIAQYPISQYQYRSNPNNFI